ncbi:MAG: 50S ribosomal protein L29 [Myxococcota bacterium]|nr:50S ribosomal protein L29 [Myxococcota bacterium]
MRERSDEELERMLTDAKMRLFRARLDNATHQLNNTSQIRATRREIARINTLKTERRQHLSATDGNAPQSGEE